MATIAENLQTIQNIKRDIKTAIENKGVDMSNTPFSDYSTKIDEISTGSGTFVVPDGMKFAFSSIKKLPETWDFSEITNASSIFSGCKYLETAPNFTNTLTKCDSMFRDCYRIKTVYSLDTSTVTNFNYMYYMCQILKDFPEIDTSNGLTFNCMYENCKVLEEVPPLYTEKATEIEYLFSNCVKLKVFPSIITSNVKKMGKLINNCTTLTSLPKLDCGSVTSTTPILDGNSSYLTNLTVIGGFENLKVSWSNYFLAYLPNLTVESLMNVINYLWDWSGNTDGYAPLNDGTNHKFGTTHKLKFGQTNLDKLSEEQIAVATAKGWTLTA